MPLRDMINTLGTPGKRAQSSHNAISPGNTEFIKIRQSQNLLPPLKAARENNEQEKEMKSLIKKNLLMQDTKAKVKNKNFLTSIKGN